MVRYKDAAVQNAQRIKGVIRADVVRARPIASHAADDVGLVVAGKLRAALVRQADRERCNAGDGEFHSHGFIARGRDRTVAQIALPARLRIQTRHPSLSLQRRSIPSRADFWTLRSDSEARFPQRIAGARGYWVDELLR